MTRRHHLDSAFGDYGPVKTSELKETPVQTRKSQSNGNGYLHSNGRPRNGRRQQGEREPTAAETLVSIAQENSEELWHDSNRTACVTIVNRGHREHYPVDSHTTKFWLSSLYWTCCGKAVSAQALEDAIRTLTGMALYEGAEHPSACRVAERDGNIYLDLADDDWRVVEVTPEGWRVVDDSPVRFLRRRGMLPLPVPTPGGDVDALRQFLNVATENDWTLILAWLVATLSPRGPYPVLQLAGEQGTGKSTCCRLLRSLIDPNAAAIRAEPREVRDLMVAATNGWVMCLDNLSAMPAWLSDALCRLSTGGGFSTRQLFSDAEEFLFDAQRPVVMNGIAEVASRPDLIDRCLTVTLEPIPDTRRMTERELWKRFHAARPAILGGLLNLVATALRRQDKVRLDRIPRMADFAQRATAALGDRFLDAYDASRKEAVYHAIDADPVAGALLLLCEKRGPWSGTVSELLSALTDLAGEPVTRQRDWPSRPNALSGRLRRLAPVLRQQGVVVTFVRLAGTGKRRVTITPGGSTGAVTMCDDRDDVFPTSPKLSDAEVNAMLAAEAARDRDAGEVPI